MLFDFTTIIDDLISLGHRLVDFSIAIWNFLNAPITTNLFEVFFEGVDIPVWVYTTLGAFNGLLIDFIKLPYVFAFNSTPSFLQLIFFYAPLLIVAPIVNWVWTLIKAIF